MNYQTSSISTVRAGTFAPIQQIINKRSGGTVVGGAYIKKND
jgi:hypothetical protein